jgi:hypothetical protein
MSVYESSDSEFESIPINKSDPLASLKKLVEARLKTARRVKNTTVSTQKSNKRALASDSEEEEREEMVERKSSHFALVSLEEETERALPKEALEFKTKAFKRTKREDILDRMYSKRVAMGNAPPAPYQFCRAKKNANKSRK